jgi:hypothetical protein
MHSRLAISYHLTNLTRLAGRNAELHHACTRVFSGDRSFCGGMIAQELIALQSGNLMGIPNGAISAAYQVASGAIREGTL